jgi:plastocyanin
MIFGSAPMSLFLSLLLAFLSPPASGGIVEGRVILVKSGSPLPDASNAVVWIDKIRGGGGSAGARAKMRSEQKRFSPRVVVVRSGGTVEFPNADPIYHNVFSVSGGNRFDLGLYRSGAIREKTFGEPGLVRVYCNIHPQMVGFVMVVDSDFAAVTGRDGSFRFEGVPPGTHTVRAWQDEGGDGQASVTVGGPTAPVTIRLDVTNFKPQPHKNKFGKDYPPGAGTDDERY